MTPHAVRPAVHAHAGWYPAHAQKARSTIEAFPQSPVRVPAKAILVPHAGWRFSGATANLAFSGIEIPPTALVLGTVHGSLGRAYARAGLLGGGIVYWPEGAWETPFGTIPVATELAEALGNCPSFMRDPMTCVEEHSAEIELPFLRHYRPDVRVVVAHVALGHSPDVGTQLLTAAEDVADALADWELKPLIVASSDMSHESSLARVKAQDAMARDAIAAFDPDALLRVVLDNDITMCGVLPTVFAMNLARLWGATRSEVLGYATSADVVGPDADYVVGYCAARFV